MKLVSTILLFTIFTMFSMPAHAHGRKTGVSIQVHKEKSVPGAGFKIKFVEMVEDSRCPTGTTCVWAGNAKVKIEVRGRRGGTRSFDLNSATQPTVASYAGYEIKLTSLTPRPAINVRINPDKYFATFEVTKKSGK